MNWLRAYWYARLRRIDMRILWPACKEKAWDMDHAKAAFAAHCYNDRAWLFLGEDEIYRFIDGLQ